MLSNEKITKSLSTFNIVFCFNKKYAFKYSLLLIFLRFIIIRDLLFFYIIKTKDKIVNDFLKRIFYT